MTDKPYGGFGFLDKVTNLNFGSNGPWLAIAVVCGAQGGETAEVDFPSEAGGTPGFPLSPAPGFCKNGPFMLNFPTLGPGLNPPVTAADLAKKIKTNAGGACVGWGVTVTEFGIIETTIFLKCGVGIIPAKQAFGLRFFLGGSSDKSFFSSFVAPKGVIKPGPYPTKYLQSNQDPGTIQNLNIQAAIGSFNATVDPVALTVKVTS